jgi:hypothetical protein
VSALEPGIYRAAVRGVPDQLVTISADGDDAWALSQDRVAGTRYHPQVAVTDARKLIVLDLCGASPKRLVQVLHNNAGYSGFEAIADQIEAQTEPARIDEPGWGEKVIAHTKEDPERRLFVHWHGASVNKNAWADNNTTCHWDRLIDPALVREGLS